MILQKMRIPDQICDEKGMYFNGDFEVKNNKVCLKAGNRIESDTYFNSFSIAKWKKYTQVSNVSIGFVIQGRCNIFVCYAWIDNQNIIRRFADNKICYFKATTEKENIILQVPDHEGVIAYYAIEAIDDVVVFNVTYLTDQLLEVNNVRFAVGICTYRRESFVKKNVEIIREYISNQNSVLCDNLDIIISDNGRTLDNYGLKDGRHLYIYENDNLGGTGGFTRCIIETLNRNEYTHIVLLDDDIELHPIILEHMFIFASVLKHEYMDIMIGGAMFVLDEKFRQFENAAYYRKGMLRFTQKNIDVRTIRNVIQNEKNKTVNYNAWCCCCMPISKLSYDSLPLPFFIHMDDVEYGVRNQFEVVTLNGINVWHPFMPNQRGASIVYYDIRNKLITMAELGGVDIRDYALYYLEMFHRSIFNYDYNRTIVACRAIEDFCKGIDYFKSIDAQRLNKELKKYDNTWIDDVDKMIYQQIESNEISSDQVVGRKKLIENYFLPNKRNYVVLKCDISAAFPFRVQRLFLYNHNSYKYRVYEKSIIEMIKAKRACKKAKKLIKTELLDVSFEWKDRIKELQTITFWRNYLNLESYNE